MDTLKLVAVIAASLLLGSCGSVQAAQPLGSALLKGKYVFWSTGQLWNQAGQQGQPSLPPGIPSSESTTLFDAGTFEADGEGHATQCGAGSWGTYNVTLGCVHWTYQFGVSDGNGNLNPRLGLTQSDVGDKATLACTETGKHCVMTSHFVGWSWTQTLDRE
jgi:hypothetical protein